jgi:hypothetical protein
MIAAMEGDMMSMWVLVVGMRECRGRECQPKDGGDQVHELHVVCLIWMSEVSMRSQEENIIPTVIDDVMNNIVN